MRTKRRYAVVLALAGASRRGLDCLDWLYRNWLGKAALEYQNQLKLKLADAEARHGEWPSPSPDFFSDNDWGIGAGSSSATKARS